MRIGAQLYTVREHCKNLEDFAQTLKKVADIGYEYVQVSGTCEYEPNWLKKQLDGNGLKCVLTHIAPQKLTADPAGVAKEHDVFSCRYIGLGWNAFAIDKGDTPEAFYHTYIQIARTLKENGKYFMYHNHDQEFQKYQGRTILQRLSEDFSADEMGFTLDTFWIAAGGADPAWWIEYLAGRVPCIHLKDFAYGRKMAVIGEGNICFERVFACAERAGTEYMLVEQDDCGTEDAFACLKRSYDFLRANGFR